MNSSVEKFIADSAAPKLIEELKAHFAGGKPVISDVHDTNYQYVDLVQQGGGVWGIALVGFTYVLEQMGIRFFSLAGTSAGAINSMMLACMGNKEDAKSEKLIEAFVEKKLFDLVDGKSTDSAFTRYVKLAVQRFVVHSDFANNVIGIVHWSIVLLLTFCFASFIIAFLPGAQLPVIKWISFAAGIIFIAVIIAIALLYILFKKFSKNGNGLNEGNNFFDWIKDLISSQYVGADPVAAKKIMTLEDFQAHFMRIPPNLTVTDDANRENKTIPDTPIMAIIASDISAERKIEFPRMWDLYWNKMTDIHPANFVRASMSIPIFFQTYTVAGVDHNSKLEIWKKHLNWKGKTIPEQAQFVDGGALSNFPISVFATLGNPCPRLPTIGIRLVSELPDQTKSHRSTLAGYAGSIVGTMRANYDRDFANKNRSFEFGVKEVFIKDLSWLNFFMTPDQELQLFNCGVTAAGEFLKRFDWPDYKLQRTKDALAINLPNKNLVNFYQKIPDVQVAP